jgi:hypothetical protein
MKGADVRKWQLFLIGQGLPLPVADGIFGGQTFNATLAFQHLYGLDADGVVGHQTLVAAIQRGFVVLDDPGDTTRNGPNWPPRPAFAPLTGTAARQAIFGRFSYKPDPQPDNPEHIRILGSWVADNIVSVAIPQLAGVDGAPRSGKVEAHRLVAGQLAALWRAWQDAQLLDRVLTWGGSFAPRFVRGSSTSLSNHAFGTAFDINMDWNRINTQPALLGAKGSVRELVGIANDHGFYWGGHYSKRLDGMHFEVAQLQP